MLTFNEALNVIAFERPRVNLLSFTIRQHDAVRLFSRNQSAGGLHLIPSYVTLCKQWIQSCDAETTFPRVQNWKISPLREDITSSKGNGEKRSRRTVLLPRFYEGIPNRKRTKLLSSLSLYLVGPISLYRPRSMHRALRLFVSVKKKASLAPDPVFSRGSNLKGNLCVRKNDRDYR